MNRAGRPFIEIIPHNFITVEVEDEMGRRILRQRRVLVENQMTIISRTRKKPRILRSDPTRRMIDKLIGQQIIVTNKEILETFRFFRHQRRFVMPTIRAAGAAYSSPVLARTVSQDRL